MDLERSLAEQAAYVQRMRQSLKQEDKKDRLAEKERLRERRLRHKKRSDEVSGHPTVELEASPLDGEPDARSDTDDSDGQAARKRRKTDEDVNGLQEKKRRPKKGSSALIAQEELALSLLNGTA